MSWSAGRLRSWINLIPLSGLGTADKALMILGCSLHGMYPPDISSFETASSMQDLISSEHVDLLFGTCAGEMSLMATWEWMSENPCTIPCKIKPLSDSFQRHFSHAGKCSRKGGREGGEGASNWSSLAQRDWCQLGPDPCGWWCCVCYSTCGTHGQTCTMGACSQWGC